MQITETLQLTRREDWRAWLETHHKAKSEVWLISYKKAADMPSLPYSDAVEEALCFGWIDSIRKTVDEVRLAQRFTPRRPGRAYSQPNIERLRRLADAGSLTPKIRAAVTDLLAKPFEYPDDIIAALQASDIAWEHFQRFSAPYRRIRVAYVDSARDQPAEFEKRLAHLVTMTERGRQFGYGIEAFFGLEPSG